MKKIDILKNEVRNNFEDKQSIIDALKSHAGVYVDTSEKDSLCVTIYSSNWKRFLGGFFVNKTKLADGTEYWICSARPKR